MVDISTNTDDAFSEWRKACAGDEQDAANWAYDNAAILLAEIDELRAEVESFGDERTVLLARIRELRVEVERLHLELERHQVTGDYEMGQHHANAALEAEVERLKAEQERIALDWIDEVGPLRDENERLRAALQTIICDSHKASYVDKVAREALKQAY